MQTLIDIVVYGLHIFACLVLIGVVLLQQGKGGGMGAALGGASAQVFGGRGAGNLLTRATAICATIFMLTSVTLAYRSSTGDASLLKAASMKNAQRKEKGQLVERPKEAPPTSTGTAPAPAPTGSSQPTP
jgi:preprotein translocase subunit SecG